MARVNRKQRRYIQNHPQLSAEELAQKLDLTPEQVQEILDAQAEVTDADGNGAKISDAADKDRKSILRMGGALIAVLTAIVYLPALSNGFVNWDDPQAVLDNRHLRSLSGENLYWILSTFHTGNWIPLTWLSHLIDVQLWGYDAQRHHLVNVACHALNTVLVYGLTLRLLEWKRATANKSQIDLLRPEQDFFVAFLAAGLFGLHPLHVESVAWVSERKDLLCALFFLSALCLYLPKQPDRSGPSPRSMGLARLATVFTLFLLALLAKPMAVTLPLILLLLDYWPLGRLREAPKRVLIEKIPFLVASLVFGVIAIRAQAEAQAIADFGALTFDFRIMNAFHAIQFYLQQLLLPLELVPLHPLANPPGPDFTFSRVLSALLVVAITCAAWFWGVRRRPYLLVAWIYFLITLAPVLGLLQVGGQSSADRYTYLPSLGPTLLAAAALIACQAWIFRRFSTQALRTFPPFLLAGAVLLMALSWKTRSQLRIWKDSVSLWEQVIVHYPDVSQLAHTNLGNAYMDANQSASAIREYQRAIKLPPPHPFPYNGLGRAHLAQGQNLASVEAFKKAIELDPRYAQAYRNLWFVLTELGRDEEALSAIRNAVELNPDFAEAHSTLGISYGRMKRWKESEASFLRAIELEPRHPGFRINLGATYLQAGDLEKARVALVKALEIKPDMIEAHRKLALLYKTTNQPELARRHTKRIKALLDAQQKKPRVGP